MPQTQDLVRRIPLQGAGSGEIIKTTNQRFGRPGSGDLVSVQRIELVDLLSEGPIAGLVDGLRSVFLDDVPAKNADGSINIHDFGFALQLGGPTDEGTLAGKGFDEVFAEQVVGVEIPQAVPAVRSVVDPTVNAVRVTLSFPTLSYSNDDGSLGAVAVSWAIDVQSNGGGFVQKYVETIIGRSASTYQLSVRVSLADAGPPPWDVRVRRVSPDSTDQRYQNKFFWASHTNITSVRMAYRHTAAVGLHFDARYYPQVPVRRYDLMGYCEWEVPSNYDPIARTYTGLWNGTFKLAWTNNPAWVYYGLATNERFGMGAFVSTRPDKWVHYELAQWCDGLVPDGKGGMEPRYTINTQLTQQKEALALLQEIAAVFRGATLYGGAAISVAWDAPGDAVALYTPANVVEGEFHYSDGSFASKRSSCTVWYNDLSQLCKSVPITWEDPDLLAKYGKRPMSLQLLGCTSPGQALRQAKWALYTIENEDHLVSFRVTDQGALGRVGKVFAVADPAESGERLGGRVRAGSTPSLVVLDAPVLLVSGETYTLHLSYPSATDPTQLEVQTRAVTTGPGEWSELAVAVPFAGAVPVDTTWVLQANTVAPTLWRYQSIREERADDGALVYTVAGVRHEPAKWALIEQAQPLTALPLRRLADKAVKPLNLSLVEVVAQDGQTWKSTLVVGWESAFPGQAYVVHWRYAGRAWAELATTTDVTVDIGPLEVGTVEVEVRATLIGGDQLSDPLTGSIAVAGAAHAAANVVGLTLTNTSKGVVATWAKSTDFDYTTTELRLDGANPDAATPLASVAATAHNLGWLTEGVRTVWARHWRRQGPPGAWVYSTINYAGPAPLLDVLQGRISQAQLDAALSNTVSGAATQAQTAIQAIALEVQDRTLADGDLAKRSDVLTAQGDNLVGNAGFVAGGGHWDDQLLMDRVSSGVPSGAPSDRVLASLVRNVVLYDRPRTGLAWVPVIPGEVLDSSVWVGQAQTQPDDVGMLAACFDAAKTQLDLWPALVFSAPGSFTGWRLLSGTLTVPAGVYYVTPILWVNRGQFTVPVYFSRPQVVRRAASALAAQAAVANETTARATQDAALAQQISTVQANVGAVDARVTSEATARASGDGALALRADELAAGNAAGAITADRYVLAPTEHWIQGVASVVAGSRPFTKAFRAGEASAFVGNKRWVTLDTSRTYQVQGRFRRGPGVSYQYLIVELVDSGGFNISADGTYWFYPSAHVDPGTDWVLATGLFGAGTGRPFPPTAVAMKCSAMLNYHSTLGTWHEVEDLCILAADLVREVMTLNASISTVSQAVASGDMALAQQISTLAASTDSGLAAANAAIGSANTVRAQGDAAVAQTVTTLASRLDNSEAGPNLLPNAGFEVHNGSLPAGWLGYNNGGAGEPTSWTVMAGPDGFNAVRVAWSGPAYQTKGLYLYPLFAAGWRAGQKYIVAVRARAANAAAVGSGVELMHANWGWVSGTYLRHPALTTEWQWTVALVEAVKDGELYISSMSLNGTAVADGAVDFAQPIVHEGTIFRGFNLGKDYALSAAITQADQARVDGDTALANQVSTLTTSVNGVAASVTQESQARATVDDQLSAQWSVKVDANGKWAGLRSRSYGDTSYIDMLADIFRIASASGNPVPFFSVYTVPTVVNGVTLPAGVYVNDLFFGVLNGNRIVAQSIDTAQLKVGSASAGSAFANSFSDYSWVSGTTATRTDALPAFTSVGGWVTIQASMSANVGNDIVNNIGLAAGVSYVGMQSELLVDGLLKTNWYQRLPTIPKSSGTLRCVYFAPQLLWGGTLSAATHTISIRTTLYFYSAAMAALASTGSWSIYNSEIAFENKV